MIVRWGELKAEVQSRIVSEEEDVSHRQACIEGQTWQDVVNQLQAEIEATTMEKENLLVKNKN